MVNVGVLGFAHSHVMSFGKNWMEHPELGVKITGGWDRDPARCAESCAALNARPFPTPEELLSSDIQAVVVSCETKFHPDMVEIVKAGNMKLINALTGKVMKVSNPKPNPKMVTEIILAKLGL